MTAPATAPIGPSTTAPDTAPNAASPARSSAIAVGDSSARVRATLAIVFFIRDSPLCRTKQILFRRLTQLIEYDPARAKRCHQAGFLKTEARLQRYRNRPSNH